MVFVVTLDKYANGYVNVNFTTSDGTATAEDGDYISANGTLTIDPGFTSAEVLVSVNGDRINEVDETLAITLSDASANVTLDRATATGIILTEELPGETEPVVAEIPSVEEIPSEGLVGFSFVLGGNPEDADGAWWSYEATVENVEYKLAGIVKKPATDEQAYPAVVLSHGGGVNAAAVQKYIGEAMRSWGLVTISVHLAHADTTYTDGPIPTADNLPGVYGRDDNGASNANILRLSKCLEILDSLGYVDMNRVAVHGHSQGAWAITAFVNAKSNELMVASHSAGGVTEDLALYPASATPVEASNITIPYLMQHGDEDTVVPLAHDQALAAILEQNNVEHDLVVYTGVAHSNLPGLELLATIQDWYQKHGLFGSR